jgi:uncharacterized protein with GYD domain
MPKYLVRMCYSPGSWARMIYSHGDRTKALRRMMEAPGGSLDCLYWQSGTEDALAIADLPDSISANALTAASTKTGAFKSVETPELLTQEQLLAILDVARDAAEVSRYPASRAEASLKDSHPWPSVSALPCRSQADSSNGRAGLSADQPD